MAKTCFVISVIGSQDSPERRHADLLKDHIISPAIAEMGYDTPVRADEIDEPGQITNQIIKSILNSDLIIADLTHENGNVFYELAAAHAFGRPAIHMAKDGSELPFDNAQARTIFFDIEVDKANAAIERLKATIKAIEGKEKHHDTPIGGVVEVQTVESSEDPHAQTLASLLENQHDLMNSVNAVQNDLRGLSAALRLTTDSGHWQAGILSRGSIPEAITLTDLGKRAWTEQDKKRWVRRVMQARKEGKSVEEALSGLEGFGAKDNDKD